MKGTLATWPALLCTLAFILGWCVTSGFGADPFPWILLNLCLSCFAALQCFVLLIAGKRGEQISAEIAQHTLENTEMLRSLVEHNTALHSTQDKL